VPRFLTLCLLVSLAVAGCNTKTVKTGLDAEDHYLRGEKFLKKKHYLQAIEEFRIVTYNFPGSDLVDDAQYGLAEVYFLSGDYVNAISEYQKILRDYPLSPYVDEAQFKIALSYFHQSLPPQLDQENTYKALEEFNRFLEEYPSDGELVDEARRKILECRTKLAEKAFLNAKLYERLGDYEAALIYYGEVVSEYSDTKWFAHAQFGIGEVLLKQGKKEEALEAFKKVLNGSENRKLKRKASKRIDEIVKKR